MSQLRILPRAQAWSDQGRIEPGSWRDRDGRFYPGQGDGSRSEGSAEGVHMSRKDIWEASLGEGTLILVLAAVGWVSHQPFIFASLGPTAFEQVETPERPSAHPYNVVVGHMIAVAAGYAAIAAIQAWNAPPVSAHGVPLPRVWTAVLACVLTVAGTKLARATQPAALSTTLLVSLGIMQSWVEGGIIVCAVLLITSVGEPIRRLRLKHSGS